MPDTGLLRLSKRAVCVVFDQAVRRPAVALPLVVFVVFWPALLGEPVYDDVLNFTRNPAMRGSDLWSLVAAPYFREHLNYWRPLSSVSMWAAYQFGMSGVHLLAMLVHALASVVAQRLARDLLQDARAAFAVAALFAVHPLHVESVAWASALPDPLSSLFVFLGVHATVRWLQAGAGWPWRATAWLSLALLSKESAVVAPVLALLVGVRVAPQGRSTQWRRLAVAFALMTLGWLLLRAAVRGDVGAPPADAGSSAVTAFGTVEMLLRAAALPAWPWPLTPFRSLWSGASGPSLGVLAGAALGLVGTLWLTRRVARKLPAAHRAGLLLLWLPLLLPALLHQRLGEFPLADRYLYVSVLGFSLAYVACTLRKPAILGATCLVFAIASFVQCPVWRDQRSLVDHGLATAPEEASVHVMAGNLHLAEAQAGDQQALARAGAAFDKALKLFDVGRAPTAERRSAALVGSAWVVFVGEQGRGAVDVPGTIARFRRAIDQDEHAAGAWVGLGVAYATGRQTTAARQAFTHALEIDPESPEAWFNLGYLYWETGDMGRAKESLRRALQCNPGLTAAADLLARIR